jgi:hypothetical protein
MSTILKALRRLELEKSAQEGRPLKDEVTAGSDGGARRGFPLLWTMIAAGALGLGLGSSVLWLWPRENAGPAVVEAAAQPAIPPVLPAPPAPAAAVAAAPIVPEPEVMAPPPVPVPEPAASLPAFAPPEPEPAVASAPPTPKPAAAFSSPVEVIARPEPVRPAPAPEPEAAADPQAAPRGSQPPFSRSRRAAASEPAAEYVQPPIETPPADQIARIEKPVHRAAPARAPEPVAPAGPNLLVSSTIWHPQHDRRSAMVSLEGAPARELHEGDAIGSLVVTEIGPSSVTFLNDGAPLKRRVGAKN